MADQAPAPRLNGIGYRQTVCTEKSAHSPNAAQPRAMVPDVLFFILGSPRTRNAGYPSPIFCRKFAGDGCFSRSGARDARLRNNRSSMGAHVHGARLCKRTTDPIILCLAYFLCDMHCDYGHM